MKVFLDTNVLASATATRGLCADVLREALASHTVVTSVLVLEELRRVLQDKFRVPLDLIDDVLQLLHEDAIVAEPAPLANLRLRDKADHSILSSAVNGRAEVFVTGDKELVKIGRIGDVKILSPRQFWEKVTAPPRHRVRRGRPRA